jgi:hypothetical protein
VIYIRSFPTVFTNDKIIWGFRSFLGQTKNVKNGAEAQMVRSVLFVGDWAAGIVHLRPGGQRQAFAELDVAFVCYFTAFGSWLLKKVM